MKQHGFNFLRDLFSQESIDKTISGGLKGQIRLLIIVIGGVLVIGSLVFYLLHSWIQPDASLLDQIWLLYNNFIDTGNLQNQETWPARLFLGFISLLGSILLGGILISTISNIVERRVDKVRTGRAYYKKIQNHFVLIGFSQISSSLIKVLHAQDPKAKILVMSSLETDFVRHRLQTQLSKEEEENLHIYFGNLESKEELERLNIPSAQEVYILSEEKDMGRDSRSIRCLSLVSQLRGENVEQPTLPVYVQIEHPTSYSVIQKIDLPENFYKYQAAEARANETKNVAAKANEAEKHAAEAKANEAEKQAEKKPVRPKIYFRPFNSYENWARQLWSLYALDTPYQYAPLDFDPIGYDAGQPNASPARQVHLVIVGFGYMGQALLLEALRICHYAYYNDNLPEGKGTVSLITVVDKDATALKEQFDAFYPNTEAQIDDILLDFRETDLSSAGILSDLKKWSLDKHQQLTIAICISDPDIAFHLGLNLPREIYQGDTQLLIRQEYETELGGIVHRDTGRYKNIKVFGMLETGISKHIMNDDLAAFIHKDYQESEEKRPDYIKNLYATYQQLQQLETKIQRQEAWIDRYESIEWDDDKIMKYTRLYEQGWVEVKKAKKRIARYKALQQNIRTTRYDKQIQSAFDDWYSLNENLRWADRYQIDMYLTFIRTLGLDILPSNQTLRSGQVKVSPEEIEASLAEVLIEDTPAKQRLLTLMRMEKYRWNAERTIEGWRNGKTRDNPNRIHTLIVPFNSLPEKEKTKDRNVIVNMPYLLVIDGYTIVKSEKTE